MSGAGGFFHRMSKVLACHRHSHSGSHCNGFSSECLWVTPIQQTSSCSATLGFSMSLLLRLVTVGAPQVENYRHSRACHKAHPLSPQGNQELSQRQGPECVQSKGGGFREIFVCGFLWKSGRSEPDTKEAMFSTLVFSIMSVCWAQGRRNRQESRAPDLLPHFLPRQEAFL